MPLFREPLYQPGGNTFFLQLLRFLYGELKRFKSSIVEPSPDVNPAIHSEIRLRLCGQKTQTESPNLDYSNLNYLIPGHINRWEGTFKPLTQRRMISLNQTNFYQILHTAPSSRGNLGVEGGAKECFRGSPTRNDTNSSGSDRRRRKMTAGKEGGLASPAGAMTHRVKQVQRDRVDYGP